eukprot:m51a1_g1123 hypothetical protein (145) ;mRNA; f:188348-189329
MADVSNSDIATAYADVVADANPTTWAVFGYESKTSNKLILQGRGEGGIDELKALLKDDECQFAYIRLTVGDNESKRAKFVFISWVGEEVSPIRRAKMSVHKADVKTIIKNFAVEIHATRQDEVNEEILRERVIKAGGANYSANT